ncbi:MAG TPA: hypothetical protein VFF29_00470 [Bacteroidota bacterium]|nr:hypothetical protein [Bacteroidota bacterium]
MVIRDRSRVGVPIINQACSFLQTFRQLSENGLVRYADDLLSYFHNLHDNFAISKSKSPRFSGNTFIILEEIIYQLESNPDETLKNSGLREFILQVLEDICVQRITIARKHS